jgi:asparagine synthase (glutamine-hydrolysing)
MFVDVAERTAAQLGVQLHKQHMDEDAIASRFEDATWHCEHHNRDLNYVGKFALSETPRELGSKVVLTGEGAEETFTGYREYLPDVLREADMTWDSKLPESTRLSLLGLVEAETAEWHGLDDADGGSEHFRRPTQAQWRHDRCHNAAFIPTPIFADWTSTLNC